MAISCSVSVIEQCRISPPSGSVPPMSLPLTIFDVIWLPLPHVQRLFLYELHQHSKEHFTNTILPKIKHSLSLTLQHFFPLAGNLAWPQDSSKPEIHYVDGDSMSLTVAESDYDFGSLVGNHAKDVSRFYKLVPPLVNSRTEKLYPLMAIQVTWFREEGISIGITFEHAFIDGRALHHFIKTWTSLSKLEGTTSSIPDSLLPSYNRSFLEEANPMSTVCSNFFKMANITRDTFYNSKPYVFATDKVFATFVMRLADINGLKQRVLSHFHSEKNENALPMHLSTFVLTCAYVWVCSVKARWREDAAVPSEDDPMEYFLFPMDCRECLDPPLPMTYFGNCLTPGVVGAKRSDLIQQQGIPIAAVLIGNAIRDREIGKAIIKHLQGLISSEFSVPQQLLSVAGSAKLGIYDTDFGWGKPKKTQVVSIAMTGAISLSECSSELGSVEIGLVRDSIEMDAFASFFAKTLEDIPPCSV